jgi:hypothetical protein
MSIKECTDMIHQEIKINDTVVYSPPYSSGIQIGVVQKISKSGKTLNIRRTKESHGVIDIRRSKDVVVINNQYTLAIESNPEFFI